MLTENSKTKADEKLNDILEKELELEKQRKQEIDD